MRDDNFSDLKEQKRRVERLLSDELERRRQLNRLLIPLFLSPAVLLVVLVPFMGIQQGGDHLGIRDVFFLFLGACAFTVSGISWVQGCEAEVRFVQVAFESGDQTQFFKRVSGLKCVGTRFGNLLESAHRILELVKRGPSDQ